MSDDEGAAISWKVEARNWLVLLLLMGATIFSLIDRFALSIMVDPIKAHFNLTDGDIGLINGIAFGVFYSVMGLPFGFLADRWSRKGAIVIGMTVWSLATAMCGLSSNVLQFVASRTLVGAGEASLAPASYAIIYDRFSKRVLSRVMSVFTFGSIIGSGLALVVAGAIYKYFENGGASFPFLAGLDSWQKTFVALSLPGIPYAILLFFMKDSVRAKSEAPVGERTRQDHSEIKRNIRRYALIFLGMSSITVANCAFLSWIPTIVSREFGRSPSEIGSLYGILFMVVSPLGLFLGGWLSDALASRGRPNAHAMVALASAGSACLLSLGLALVTSASSLLVLVGAMHFAQALAAASTPAYIQIVTPRYARSQISAVYVLVLNFMGLGVGPTLIGWLSSLSPHDPQALRLAVAAVVTPSLALGALLLAVLVWQERRPTAAPAAVAA